jgi:hypothetical protein
MHHAWERLGMYKNILGGRPKGRRLGADWRAVLKCCCTVSFAAQPSISELLK